MNQIIENALIKFPKAKRIAVENVACGVTKMDMAFHINFAADCAAYNWNAHTIAAIKWVIAQNAKQLGK
jgi:hypothetical protein